MATASPAPATETENLYEGMFLLDSGKFAADPDGATSQLLGILEKAGAKVVASRPWQDGKLAYPINGQRKGMHFLTYFHMEGEGATQITRSCKLSDLVMRHMLIKHPQTLFDAMVEALQMDTESKVAVASSDDSTDSDSSSATSSATSSDESETAAVEGE